VNITIEILSHLVSIALGAILAIKYGVSITGVIKADLLHIHAKIESLKSHVSAETSKVTAKVDSVVYEANADAEKMESEIAAIDAAIKR